MGGQVLGQDLDTEVLVTAVWTLTSNYNTAVQVSKIFWLFAP